MTYASLSGRNFTVRKLVQLLSRRLWRRPCPAKQRMGEVTKALGITVQGAWVNMPGHTMYFLLDAPNAHVVNQMFAELRFMEWNTVVVNPVVTLEQAMEKAQQQKP